MVPVELIVFTVLCVQCCPQNKDIFLILWVILSCRITAYLGNHNRSQHIWLTLLKIRNAVLGTEGNVSASEVSLYCAYSYHSWQENFNILIMLSESVCWIGADGSVRMFDLRHLEHSTIIYEDVNHNPLLRLAWNKQDPNYLATFAMDKSEV